MRRPVNRTRLFLLFSILFLLISVGPEDRLQAADREEVEASRYPFDIYYVLVNTEFTLLHELGHSLITELQIPVLGREEDAADQLAIMLLPGSHDEGLSDSLLRKVRSIGIELRIEAGEDTITYWDSHSPAIERFYNILCLAYGMNPASFTGYLENDWLPFERGWYCDREHQQVLGAIRWIYHQYGRPDRSPLPALSVLGKHPFNHSLSVGRQLEAMNKSLHPDYPGKISVHYDIPTTHNGELLVQALKDSNLTENLAKQVERSFYLPRDLMIKFSNCGEDAYWNERSGKVVICYRLLELYYAHAKIAKKMKDLLPDKLTPLNVVMPTHIFNSLKERATQERTNINDLTLEAVENYLRNSPVTQESTGK